MKKNTSVRLFTVTFFFFFFLLSLSPLIAEEAKIQGITEAYYDSMLSPLVGGIVSEIKIKEGGPVKQGEVIVELAHYEQSVTFEALKVSFERDKRLFEKTQSISVEELQKKELEYKLAQVELEKKLIRAPFEGVAAKIYRKVGEYSRPEEPLVHLVDTRKCRFTAYIEHVLTSNIKSGMKTRIIVQENDSPVEFEGIIEYISPVVDPSSGLREVKVTFDNPGNKIRPGVTAVMVLGNPDELR